MSNASLLIPLNIALSFAQSYRPKAQPICTTRFKYLILIINKPLLKPNKQDFPIKYDGSDDSANKTLEIVASQMEMKADNFVLTFYDGSPPRYEADMSYYVITDWNGNEIRPAAIFLGTNKDNKFQVCLEISQLQNPEKLVATLAHEVGYIKLLYQIKVTKADDSLIDLFPLFWGLGIFTSSASIELYKNSRKYGGHKTQYHLNKKSWGYALALYAFIRDEHHPEWVKFLVPEVKKYFNRSEKFIWENKEIIFNEPYEDKEEKDKE